MRDALTSSAKLNVTIAADTTSYFFAVLVGFSVIQPIRRVLTMSARGFGVCYVHDVQPL